MGTAPYSRRRVASSSSSSWVIASVIVGLAVHVAAWATICAGVSPISNASAWASMVENGELDKMPLLLGTVAIAGFRLFKT